MATILLVVSAVLMIGWLVALLQHAWLVAGVLFGIHFIVSWVAYRLRRNQFPDADPNPFTHPHKKPRA